MIGYYLVLVATQKFVNANRGAVSTRRCRQETAGVLQ